MHKCITHSLSKKANLPLRPRFGSPPLKSVGRCCDGSAPLQPAAAAPALRRLPPRTRTPIRTLRSGADTCTHVAADDRLATRAAWKKAKNGRTKKRPQAPGLQCALCAPGALCGVPRRRASMLQRARVQCAMAHACAAPRRNRGGTRPRGSAEAKPPHMKKKEHEPCDHAVTPPPALAHHPPLRLCLCALFSQHTPPPPRSPLALHRRTAPPSTPPLRRLREKTACLPAAFRCLLSRPPLIAGHLSHLQRPTRSRPPPLSCAAPALFSPPPLRALRKAPCKRTVAGLPSTPYKPAKHHPLLPSFPRAPPSPLWRFSLSLPLSLARTPRPIPTRSAAA